MGVVEEEERRRRAGAQLVSPSSIVKRIGARVHLPLFSGVNGYPADRSSAEESATSLHPLPEAASQTAEPVDRRRIAGALRLRRRHHQQHQQSKAAAGCRPLRSHPPPGHTMERQRRRSKRWREEKKEEEKQKKQEVEKKGFKNPYGKALHDRPPPPSTSESATLADFSAVAEAVNTGSAL